LLSHYRIILLEESFVVAMTIKSSSPEHECETRISTTTVSAVGGREVTRPRKEESESETAAAGY